LISDERIYAFTRIGFICFGIMIGMGILGTFKTCVKEPQPAVACMTCDQKQKDMTSYFKSKKVKSPEQMAEAVLKTRNPRLLAAIHVGGEKRTPHTSMNTGYKNRYSGAWQTSDHWGKVNADTSISDQALIAELAINTHVTEEKDIIMGLNAYGGERNKRHGKYAYNVLKEFQYGGIPQ
jgi:hypothetical protein